MSENILLIIVGLVMILASILGVGLRYGMAPSRGKPVYPFPRPARIAVFVIGLMACCLGVARLLAR